MMNGISMGVIFLTLVQSTISLYLYERGMEATSKLFDQVSFFVLGLAYLVINIAVPLTAIL
jgi:hypothetical protein